MLPKQNKQAGIIESAQYVLKREIEGLEALHEVLNDSFIHAVELLHNLTGRLVVSGMGKSGHIARKIAATFASTGTPALFVHPGEASHGDLGMVTRHDIVMLLSNSGETSELHDIINYCKRFSITVIGIVRRKSSTLVDAADITLVLPEIPEASPVGAPTTSTTMMLALGDALAVATLEQKGFSKEDFGIYHPGGKLGQALVKVENLMHTGEELPVVQEDTSMPEVLIEMTAKRLGCTAVLNKKGVLTGIITDGDLRRHINRNMLDTNAKDIMTKNPVTISSQYLVTQALQVMEDKSITSLFIIDEKSKPLGVIHIHDILRAGVA